MNIETERKFLIELPDTKLLTRQNCRVLHIVQTYLAIDNEKREESRVRRIEENGETRYVYTEKKKISALSRIENEYEITEEKYNSLRESHDIRELEKTRYAFEYGGHTVEIDVYPHEIGGDALDGYAVLEVEFERENEEIQLPDFIRIVRELTGTSEFSNKTLAKPVV